MIFLLLQASKREVDYDEKIRKLEQEYTEVKALK